MEPSMPPVEQTPPTPLPATSSHSGLSRIGFIIPLFSFIILLLLTATAFLAYQNMQLQKQITDLQTSPPTQFQIPTPTPSIVYQKTYTNNRYQFTLTHPSDWEIRPDETGYIQQTPGVIERVTIGPTSLQGGHYAAVEIRKQGVDAYIAELMQQTNQYNEHLKQLDNAAEITTLASRKEGTFLNQNATMLTFLEGSTKKEYYIIEKNGSLYSFFVHLEPTNGPIAQQILSTFTFTNQPTPTSPVSAYTCPVNGWQNCMPILSEEGKRACSPEAFDWYEANCPNFQGGAY